MILCLELIDQRTTAVKYSTRLSPICMSAASQQRAQETKGGLLQKHKARIRGVVISPCGRARLDLESGIPKYIPRGRGRCQSRRPDLTVSEMFPLPFLVRCLSRPRPVRESKALTPLRSLTVACTGLAGWLAGWEEAGRAPDPVT